MNIDFPRSARFIWQAPDGAMRMGVGHAVDLHSDGVTIESSSIPNLGAAVQVLLDTPCTESIDGAGRLIGKGIVVSSDSLRAFEADLHFSHFQLASRAPGLEFPQTPGTETSLEADLRPSLSWTEYHPISSECAASVPSSAADITNRRVARIFAAAALLVLLFAGRVTPHTQAQSHTVSLDMRRAPRPANLSTW